MNVTQSLSDLQSGPPFLLHNATVYGIDELKGFFSFFLSFQMISFRVDRNVGEENCEMIDLEEIKGERERPSVFFFLRKTLFTTTNWCVCAL